MKRAALVVTAMVLLSWLMALAGPAEAAPPTFDFQRHVVDELARPNVRMVAVVFSADWCEPCQAEEEQWRRIKEIYGPRGLRVVVIRYRDAAARMKVYDWPDQEVWDDNGRVGEAFEIGMALPAAFLWGWDGQLLAKKITARQMVSQINEYLLKSPRVVVEAVAEDGETPLPTLQAVVEGELIRLGKFDIAVNQADRERMELLRKASHAPNRSDKERCKLGMEMSPNSVVTAKPLGGNLLLTLKDIERACLIRSVAIPINPENPPATVAEGVASLVSSLRLEKIERPSQQELGQKTPGAVTREAERSDGGTVDDFGDAGAWQTMLLRSNPPGATIRLEEMPGQVKRPDDGEEIVRWRLEGGRPYTAVFEMPLYKPERVSFRVKPDQREIFAKLTPDFGELHLFSEPSGLQLFINGANEGKTPLKGKRIQAGESLEVEVVHPCFKPYRITGLQLQAGERREERMELVPKLALVEIVLTDTSGHLKGGVLYADGQKLGSTDDKHKVSVCSKKLKVVPNDKTLNSWKQNVELTQGEIHTFSVTSNNRKHRAKVEAKHSERERLIEEEIAAVFFTVDGGTVKDTGLKLTQLTWLIQPWAWDQRRVFSGVAVTFGDGHDGPDDFDGSDDFDDFDGPDGGSVSAEWMLGYQWWLTTWFAPYLRGQIGHSKTAPNELAVGTEVGGNLYLLKDLLVLRGGVKWSHEHGVYGFVGGGVSWSVLGLFF